MNQNRLTLVFVAIQKEAAHQLLQRFHKTFGGQKSDVFRQLSTINGRKMSKFLVGVELPHWI